MINNLIEDFNLKKLIEILKKSEITGRLDDFFYKVFKMPDNLELSTNSIITIAFTNIIINKFKADFKLPGGLEEHSIIKEVSKKLLDDLLNQIQKNVDFLPDILKTFMIKLKLILINLLLLKFKHSLVFYDLAEKLIFVKTYFKENHDINQTTSEFLSIYLEINTRISNHGEENDLKDTQAINYIFSNSSLYKSLILDLNDGRDLNDCELKVFSDFLNKREKDFQEPEKNDNERILLFERHINYKNKINEIISMDLGTNFLFYGNPSSCKTTIAKIFTKDEIVIDVDETIEVNNLLGGYLINEFSEIIWQDGLLIKALLTNKDLIIRNMEKCSNELFFILKQIVEKKSVFINLKQELTTFNKLPKIFFIFNNDTGEDLLNSNDIILNFLISNTFHFHFVSYSDTEKIQIALHNRPLLKKINEQQLFLETIMDTYNKIIKKYKFNTRFRELNLTDLIKFAERVEILLDELNLNGLNNFNYSSSMGDLMSPIFLSEKNKMKIISTFIFLVFYTLDDSNLIKSISSDFASAFNFDTNTFSNLIVNFNEIFSNTESNIIKGFGNEKITFDQLTNNSGNVYSYNSNSKFYTKLINDSVLNSFKENILLVGETGVGKTTMIQNLAKVMNTKLNVINLSQSSDVSELFGGFKPIHPKVFLKKYFDKILSIIQKHFNSSNNRNFINSFYEAYQFKEIEYFIKFSLKSLEKIEAKLKNSEDKETKNEINSITTELMKFKRCTKRGCYNAFTYIDGILLDAIKKDEWILLDEINLASDDLLLKVSPILEGEKIFLVENNELITFERGPKFRIFGSMNPEYNIGKKRLPHQLRSQFTEIFVHEIKEFHDIKTFVKTYLHEICCDDKYISEIAKLYIFIKDKQARNEIQKSNGAKCNFSLRNLSRSLITIRNAVKFYDIQTAISESINMNFMSLLNESSIDLIRCKFFNLNLCGELSKMNRNSIKLNNKNNESVTNSYLNFNNYFIKKEFINPDLIDKDIDQRFILTKTFKNHLNNLMRIVTLSNYAVLLEGPTSVGKTSIIEYIGKKIGQKILRINNNQNTEIEEYIGNYTTDSKGQFYFQEGFLVKAVKEGSWIILDEINLAPSEVLESLNRLLDDNRELFISELNTTIQAHPNFKIFAAMNPSEMYAGRKDLSEAFKNRFIHLYFDNIPEEDLEEIIEKRCKLPKSRVDIMVQIFNDLQKIRSFEGIFAKKEGFITIRDLIKWGSRNLNSYDDLAYEGYFVIAEKLRNDEERSIIKKTIEKHLNNKVHLNFEKYFEDYIIRNFANVLVSNNKLCLNKSTKRMLCLVDKCLKNREPVLLIGETGTGKTVVCEYLSDIYKKKMITISCHENIDTGDFLGSLRSVYGREEKINQIKNIITEIFRNLEDKINLVISDKFISKFVEKYLKYKKKYFNDNILVALSVKDCEKLSEFFNKFKEFTLFSNEDKENVDKLNVLIAESHKLFEWVDGPLTQAMKKGDLLIIDEISLALDSVLERMNSVFEADRVLVLSENHTKSNVEIIHPDDGFMIIATMNPSGDHGKRELSPALRSRFSEIFVDTNLSKAELEIIYEYAQILNHNFENSEFLFYDKLNEKNKFISNLDVFSLICFKIHKSPLIYKFSEYHINHTIKLIFSLFIWYNFYLINNQSLIVKTLTLRDVDMIIDFITANLHKINNESAFISIYNHSVHMTLIDGVFLNESSKPEALIKINQRIIEFTNYQTKYMAKILLDGNDYQLIEMLTKSILIDESSSFGIVPFIFNKLQTSSKEAKFVFHTENIKVNLTKILRGLTTGKPIIIEGSPGVGKTTIIQNLAKKLGKKIYRINLSEHTDMIDLIGSEYPTDDNNSKGITFKWVDGVFLKALNNGDWIIIDEMNLASQSILEGLNSVLDHRKSLFVSELSKEFKCHPDFQIFATQNPVNQGGGRKFLPKSFLNRFVKIYLNDLSEEDYKEIMKNLFPTVQEALIDKLTHFNYLCQNLLFNKHKLNMNEVGEFNLRTLIKILEIVSNSTFVKNKSSMEHILNLMYISRIRNRQIRKEMRKYIKEIILEDNLIIWESEEKESESSCRLDYLKANKHSVPHLDSSSVPINLSSVMKYSKLLLTCIQNNFPLIITGYSGIGKKEIIRYLADKTNSQLFEFALNSSMDSTELLGNFDKINLSYHLKIFKEKISSKISSINFDSLSTTLKRDYLQLLTLIDFINRKLHMKQLNKFKENLSVLKEKLKSLNLYSNYEENITQIEKVAEFISSDTFNFEWHDSILINCIINGYWIILDNVNTCSSAVLDRLNSLLDDDKQIYLNESGVNDGRIIKPHKNFRIFMIMNEKYGEVSRALKNRCVEIYFDKNIIDLEMQNKNEYSSSFNLSYNDKSIKMNHMHKSVSFRRKAFDDLLQISERLRLFDYNLSVTSAIVYLFTVCSHVIDYRLFKKYLFIFDKYYSNHGTNIENRYKIIESLSKTISLLYSKSKTEYSDLKSFVENLIKSINNSESNDIYFKTCNSFANGNLLDQFNSRIHQVRSILNISLNSSTVNLVDKIEAFDKFISLFQNDFNKLCLKHSFFMDILKNLDLIDEDSKGNVIDDKNIAKRKNYLSYFNKIIFKNSNDKIFRKEVLTKFIYSDDTSDENIKSFLRNINQHKKFNFTFHTSLAIYILYSFINIIQSKEFPKQKILQLFNSFDLNEKDEIAHFKNIFSEINSNYKSITQSANLTLNRFYLDRLNKANVEKQIKKLISSKEEERIDKIFREIRNLSQSSEDSILFASLVEFILKVIDTDYFLKFIQMNSETFLFVFENLLENFSNITNKQNKSKEVTSFKNVFRSMRKFCQNLNSTKSDNISKLIFFLDYQNSHLQFKYNSSNNSLTFGTIKELSNLNNDLGVSTFDYSFTYNLNNNQSEEILKKILSDSDKKIKIENSPLMNLILLEFDVKSAKTFSDLLSIRHYYNFTEKVNEVLTNEKLIIPVISNKNDLINVQTFVENMIKYTNYITDYENSDNKLFYSLEDLIQLNFLQKHQTKSGLDPNCIKYLINTHYNTDNSALHALSIDMINLFILNEYSSEKTIEKINYISNLSQGIITHFVNNYKKLFFIPFYYFYSKTIAETIINNYSKIIGMSKLGNKIKLFEIILNDLQLSLFKDSRVIGIKNDNSQNKYEVLESQIQQAELIATISIPDKKTISKILGKDLFHIFYETLIQNKEKILFTDKLAYDLELNNYDSCDSLEYKSEEKFISAKSNDLKIYEYIKKKLEKFEKESTNISSNHNYDNFVRDLSNSIEKFFEIKSSRESNSLSSNQIEVFKSVLKNLIINYMNNFSNLILPFALSSFIYVTALNEKNFQLRKQKTDPINFLDKVQYINSNFDSESEKMFYSFLYKSEGFYKQDWIINILLQKLNEYNRRKELDEETKLNENQSEFYVFREKLKKYETVNMRILETTKALDETTQEVRDKMKEEEEKKEIEENFPTYQDEFKNFDKLELIDLTKNININNFYNNKKEPDTNPNKGKDILYYTYLIMKKNILEGNMQETKKEQGFSLPITIDYYHTILFSRLTNFTQHLSNNTSSLTLPFNEIKLNLSFILENQYKFYKLKSKEGFSLQKDQTELDIEEGLKNLNKNNSKASKNDVIYNFYRDPNPNETRYLYIILNKLLERLSNYLRDFPDHPLLILILIITFNLLELDINSTPLSKLLSGLDILLTKLKEWETYASKRINSLEEDIKSVMILIRRLRKIEIVSWKGLLNSKMKEYERKDCLEYFNSIYKIIIEESGNKNTDEISETINLFVLNSNFASFEFRINCIKIFSHILSQTSKNFELINCLTNIYNYYNYNFILSGKFEEYKSLQLAEIEGKVKDLINIAKWDIKNYFNFRDNMKRNYKQLNKILKNFDNFCLTNIKELIEYSSKDFVSKDYVLSKFVPSENDNEPKDYFDCFSLEIFSRIESLRKLASNSNASDRKDKMFKQKALLDLIKTLKNLGFSTIYKFYQNEVYNQFKRFSLDFVEEYKHMFNSEFYFSIQKSSAYVTKILQKINNFNLIDKVHEDLNTKYLETMKGLSFSSYFKSLSVYNKIENCVKIHTELISKAFYSYKLEKSGNSLTIMSYEKYANWNLMINEFLACINMNEINIAFDSVNYVEKNRSLNEKFINLKHIKTNFEEFLNSNLNIPQSTVCKHKIGCSIEGEKNLCLTFEEINILNEFVSYINDLICNNIWSQIKDNYEIISYNFKAIVKKINKEKEKLIFKLDLLDLINKDYKNPSPYKLRENYSAYIVNKLHSSVEDYIFINTSFASIFEDFSLIDEKEEILDENDAKEIKIDDFLTKIDKIQDYFTKLINNNTNSSTLTYESKTFSILLNQMSNHLHSIIKLTNLSISIFYNVSVNGFCQPKQIQSDNKGQNEKGGVHEGGFGMSEGEGMEDISKEIEDEEQLLGLKEEKMEDAENNKKKDEKPIDKKSGFEVRTDFNEDKMEEIPEDEDESQKEEDDENLEREKDEVADERGNQMYDKDNEIEDDEEGENDSKEKGNVDLTDKSVSMKNQDKNNNYKSKDESRKDDKEKNVEKPEELGNQSENDNEADKNKEESKKVDKLDVNKNNGDEEGEEDSKQEENDKMEVDQMEMPEDKLKEVENNQEELSKEKEENNDDGINEDEANPKEANDEDLLGDDQNNNKMEVEEEAQINENGEEEAETQQRGGEEPIPEDIDDAIDKEELFKSKPNPTKNEDLGYNPISNNKGSGGNTAQRSKDNKNEIENNENDNLNEEQLESLEKYEEIFDLNSMLESVWQTRPSKQNKKKQNVNKSVKNEKTDNMQNLENNKQEEVDDNFDFHNYEDKDNKQNNNQKEDVDFDMGYADNNNEKKASGLDENKKELKDNQNLSKMEDKDNMDRNIIFDDREENIEINEKSKDEKMIIENEEKVPIIDDDNMEVESSQLSQEENENDDMIEYKPDDNQTEKTKKEILIEMDKDIQNAEENIERIKLDNSEDNEQTKEKLKKLESEMIADFQNWSRSGEFNNSIELWNKLEQISTNHINKLVEHLKIAMEPNKQTKLRGNYKSGKRLNIKKIISFIASNYRNDKIWLRRTLPFERNYYVMLAIDDSLSMKEHNLGFFAMESLVIVSTALNKAGIGKLCICAIKEDMEIYHNYNEMFDKEKGAFLLSKFKFDFSSRLSHDLAMTNFMKNSMVVLENLSKTNQNSSKVNQIVFILSDGRFNKDNVRSLCIEAKEKGLLYVFIILDKYGIDNNHSILNMNSVKHVTKPNGDIDIEVKPYLDDFPFAYYVIVEDSSDLPEVVHTILVKWFTLNN